MDEIAVVEDKQCWSYSRVTCFCNCKYEFYLNYIVNDDEQYLAEGNYYAEVGSFVHMILAMIFDGKLKKEDSAQYFIDNYENNVFYTVRQSTMDKTKETIIDYFNNLDIAWLSKYEIVGVELEMRFNVNEYDFVGYIDLLLKDKIDGKFIVLDHKSVEYFFKANGDVKKKSEHDFDTYKKQMYLYCHSVYQKYGEYPKMICWNHFKDSGKISKIPFNKKEYDKAVKWYLDTIKSITKEEAFEPTKDFFYCSQLCNFRASCEYNKKR